MRLLGISSIAGLSSLVSTGYSPDPAAIKDLEATFKAVICMVVVWLPLNWPASHSLVLMSLQPAVGI